MHRREVLRTAALAGVAGLFGSRGGAAVEAEIELRPESPGATIDPHVYGHFIEHLGGVIYDGIWVGRDSKIANIQGLRRSFVDDMKRIGAPNLRWPGGCFADGYHWRTGIGPAARRTRTYNYWEAQMPKGTNATETNEFGTHEFMALCRLVGAEPYLAANVGSATPQEFYDWVGYCNAPAGSLSLADERAANGDREPFNVRFWGVGNESWGCGGNMKPEEYATEYRKFIAQVPAYTKPFLVAVGPRGHSLDMDMGWTTGFFEGLRGARGRIPDGYALHYYTDFRPTPVKAETVANAAEWYAVLHKGALMDQVIERHWEAMGKVDREHRSKFVIDEWGNWYNASSRPLEPRYLLSQWMTLRDALHAAMTFDIFHRHAEKIAMANIAQTINCLHSLFLAQGDRYVRTPVYHVFEMYRGHMSGRVVPMTVKAESMQVPLLEGTGRMASVAGSASLKEGVLTVSLTNPGDAAMPVRLRFDGAKKPAEARASTLTHESRGAANTFESPEEVRPAALKADVSAGAVSLLLPKQSATVITVRMA
ncbi:MAG: alpha-L-arabinofuranosidase C-terminal domain-containing protein [Bryobacteraceae bacterium]|nr:alpha-L-arabinofuranosidase C-terminal domain-containing protein [Bryobacteraceae bacterium]